MDFTFDMNLDDITATTPQVLNKCVDIFSTPTHESYVDESHFGSGGSKSRNPIFSSKSPYSHHPDIQYFQKIKNRNHFNYHRSKQNSKSNTPTVDRLHKMTSTVFDPFNADQLVARLKTFTALNWHIPSLPSCEGVVSENTLNELKCARNGWKCVSFSLNNNTKNHLLCTTCNQSLVLKFSEGQQQKEYSAFDYDFLKNSSIEASCNQLNNALHNKYLDQVVYEGHSPSCSWRNFETPLEGIYYPRPYLNKTNERLLRDYLKNLKNLMDNGMILNEYADSLADCFVNGEVDEAFKQFIAASNTWLLQRHFRENKENFSVLLEFTPLWYYKLAMLGWSLHVQSFSEELILLLICDKCNQRIFLNSKSSSVASQAATDNTLNLSSSKILSPCTFPVTSKLTSDGSPDFTAEAEVDSDKFDPFGEHKQWCCNVNNVASTEYKLMLYEYLIQMVINSSDNLGANGEYVVEQDMKMEIASSSYYKFKRRKSFDINEGLDRLSKLRKLYLLEE
ncbi:hypothetical protein G9P44_002446 [Scheffersomyces stipitis]|nr:hypothetical protein G9P44_002446 [Scheffersomyces stipitis]